MPDIWPYSLPEEFLLLSQHTYGGLRDPYQTAAGCAAAELGELVLRRRLGVASAAYSSPTTVHLLDRTPIGLAWADEVVAELGRLAASQSEAIQLHTWLELRRHKSLLLHREALTDRIGPFPTVKDKRREPHSAVCEVRVSWLRAVAGGMASMDERMLFLSDLVEEAGLSQNLGLNLTIFQRIGRAWGFGAVAALSGDLRETSKVLSKSVKSFSTSGHYDHGRGRGTSGVGGGDGGGGGE